MQTNDKIFVREANECDMVYRPIFVMKLHFHISLSVLDSH